MRRTTFLDDPLMDGITITRWSPGLSPMIALTLVTASFTLVWDQTVKLGETQVKLVASVAGASVAPASSPPA